MFSYLRAKKEQRISALENLRTDTANLIYREVVEGTLDDDCGMKLETKVLNLVSDARLIGEQKKRIK